MLSYANVEPWNNAGPVELKSEVGKKTRTKWECSVSESLIGDFIVTPLTSARMLQREDEWMENGCQTYAFQCAAAKYALFSIHSKNGDQRATLGLVNNEEHWSFDLCSGPYGENVMDEILEYYDDDGILQTEWLPTELYFVAHEVVRLMNMEKYSASDNVC